MRAGGSHRAMYRCIIRDVAKNVKLLSPASAVPCLPLGEERGRNGERENRRIGEPGTRRHGETGTRRDGETEKGGSVAFRLGFSRG